MNPNENLDELEGILRQCPMPEPPESLRRRVLMRIDNEVASNQPVGWYVRFEKNCLRLAAASMLLGLATSAALIEWTVLCSSKLLPDAFAQQVNVAPITELENFPVGLRSACEIDRGFRLFMENSQDDVATENDRPVDSHLRDGVDSRRFSVFGSFLLASRR